MAQTLEGSGKLFGEHLSFLGRAARAFPVSSLRCFPGILEEAFDLGYQVGLKCGQRPTTCTSKIFFRDAQTLFCFLLRFGRFLGCKLRRNGRRFHLFGIRCGTRGGGSVDTRPRRHIPNWNQHRSKGRRLELQFRSCHGIHFGSRRTCLKHRPYLYRRCPRNTWPPPNAASSQ